MKEISFHPTRPSPSIGENRMKDTTLYVIHYQANGGSAPTTTAFSCEDDAQKYCEQANIESGHRPQDPTSPRYVVRTQRLHLFESLEDYENHIAEESRSKKTKAELLARIELMKHSERAALLAFLQNAHETGRQVALIASYPLLPDKHEQANPGGGGVTSFLSADTKEDEHPLDSLSRANR